MKILLVMLVCALSICVAKGQEQRQSLDTKSTLVVIVGMSAGSEAKTTRRLQKFCSETSSGISYLGYCNSQKCVIVKAIASKFSSADAVVEFLKNKFGSCILGRKNEPISEFYKICDFANEQEYKYFKSTYR